MVENLTELIKEQNKMSKEKPKPIVNKEEKTQESLEPQIIPQEVKSGAFDLNTIPFIDWVEKFKDKIVPRVKPVKMVIEKVNTRNTVILAVQKTEESRDLYSFRNASHIPILDAKPIYFDVFNDGIYTATMETGKGIYLKVYRVKTGLIISHCMNIDGRMIPYFQTKIKNKEKGIRYVFTQEEVLRQKLEEPADTEAIQILYRQLMKADVSKVKTKKDLFDWFAERIKITRDTNHLVMIDSTIIFMLTKQ